MSALRWPRLDQVAWAVDTRDSLGQLLGQSPRAPPSHPPWSPLGDASSFARKARIRRKRFGFVGADDGSNSRPPMCMFMGCVLLENVVLAFCASYENSLCPRSQGV